MFSTVRVRPSQVALLIVLGALLVAPLASHILGVGAAGEQVEKRALASRPPWPSNRAELAGFPRAFDAFVEDRFGFRETFIRLGSRAFYALGVSTSADVLIGKDGWLFYASEHDGSAVDGFRGVNLYSAEELDAWFSFVDEQRRWLAARNIPFIFVAVPNKHTVYPEFLPSWVNRVSPRTRLDQLVERAAGHPEFHFVDLRERLVAAKGDYPVYLKTGSHWNAIGALLGYLETMETARRYFPGVRIFRPDDFVFTRQQKGGSDLAQMLYMEDALEDLYFDFHLKSGDYDTAGAPTVLILGDSFSDYWTSFFSRSFSQVTRALRGGYGELTREWIEENEPDLVVLEMAERYL